MVSALVEVCLSMLQDFEKELICCSGRGGFQQQSYGPPATVLGIEYLELLFWNTAYSVAEMGKFVHACEGEMVCESINTKIPYFNAPIYLENKASKLIEIIQSFGRANMSLDGNRKGRRNSWTSQSSVFHD